MNNWFAQCALAAILAGAWPGEARAARSEWPLGTAEAAVLGCRSAILDRATRDFMARNKVTPEQLPKDFGEKMAMIYEPLLRTCDCSIGKIVEETSFAAFSANSAEWQRKAAEMVATGPCKVVIPDKPFTPR